MICPKQIGNFYGSGARCCNLAVLAPHRFPACPAIAAASHAAAANSPFTPLASQDVAITSPVDSRDQPRSRQRKMSVPDLQMVGAVNTLGTADNAIVTLHGSLNETIEWIKSNADN